MPINLFEGLRKLSQWQLQRLQNIYISPWPVIGDIGDTDKNDPLNEAKKYLPNGGFSPNFNGTFYVQNTSPSGLPSGNSPRGLFGWVRPFTANPSNEEGLFGYGPPSTSSGYDHNNLFFEPNNSVSFNSSSGFNPNDPNNILSPNGYNFVGMTWDGTTLTLYVNSYSWTETPGNFDTAVGYVRIALGDYWADTINGVFTGSIVDVGVWGRCPTSEEIAAIIAAGPREYNDLPGASYGLETSGGDEIACSNGDILDAFTTVGNGLVSFWNLSESSGIRYDSINYPDGNNLTAVSI